MEIDQDYLHTKFSALNVHFSSPSTNTLSSRRQAQAILKKRYPPVKSGFLPLLTRLA